MKSILKKLLFSFFAFVLIILVLFAYQDKEVCELTEKYAPSPSKFIEIDGMDVHFRDEGNKKDSLPIVLLHGTSSSLHTYNEWTNKLTKNRRVIRMDLPAFGLTGPFPNRQYSIQKYVLFLEHFLISQKIEKCVLAGNSLGGNIAWQFTVKNPKMIEKLILIDATRYPLKPDSVPIAFTIAQIPILNKLLTVITPRFMAKSSVKNVYSDKTKVTESLVDRYFNLTLRAGNRQALVDRITMKHDTLAYLNIHKIKKRTLLLWGSDDKLVPLKIAKRFHKDLPNDTLVILKNAGHVPMEESPNESLKVFLDFLNN